MGFHPLVHGFADVADDYEYGRPGYSPEFVAVLARALGIGPGARIADVGAGTGKLTRELVAAGFDVVAVEPLPGLRERLRAVLPAVEALDGTAEALPLAGASVDAVVCSDAFHWFDGVRAVAEFARVIRPGGGLALTWNHERDEDDPPPWQTELKALIEGTRPAHPSFTEDQGRGAVVDSPSFGELTLTEVQRDHHTDRKRLLAQIASMSWIGSLPAAERRDVLRRAGAILTGHGVQDVIVPLRTTIWVARRLGQLSAAAGARRPRTAR